MDRNEVELNKNGKGEQGEYSAILTELAKGFIAWQRALQKMILNELYVKVVMRIGFLVFYFHPKGERTENLFTVVENILRKKTFVQLLGLWQNVIAGTKWAILTEQYHSILPARVANHSAGFGSFCR